MELNLSLPYAMNKLWWKRFNWSHFFQEKCAYYVSICFCRNKITDIVDIYHPSLSIPQLWVVSLESSHRICSMKIGAVKKLTKFTGKHLYQSLFFKKETLAQAFSRKFCKTFKNTFFAQNTSERLLLQLNEGKLL